MSTAVSAMGVKLYWLVPLRLATLGKGRRGLVGCTAPLSNPVAPDMHAGRGFRRSVRSSGQAAGADGG
jgi:hypothetical protein